MTIYSAKLLGNDDAKVEYSVCFYSLRRRVRYWASTLPENKTLETRFMGALVAFRQLCDLASVGSQRHIAVGEVSQWQKDFESWADRNQKKISRRGVCTDELKANAAEIFDHLRSIGSDIPEGVWRGDVNDDLASVKSNPVQ